MTDQELLRAFVRDKTGPAFTELVRRHQNMVYSACLRRLEHPQQAQDAAQQTFLRLALKAPSLLHHPCPGGWLYKTALLEAGALLKNEANRRKFENAMSAQSPPADPPPDHPLLAGLDEAMLELKERERNVLVLRFFEGRSLREVGQATGATEEAARKRIVRALEHLAVLLRGRGAACTVAVLMAALSDTTQAAPARLLPAVTAAAGQTPLLWEAAAAATLTKLKIAALCTLAAAVPATLQWQANRSLRMKNAALHRELAEVRRTQAPPPFAAVPAVPAVSETADSQQRRPAPEPSENPLEAAIAALLSAESRQVDALREARLTGRLGLSEAQQREAANILSQARKRRSGGIALLAQGKVTLEAVKDVVQADFTAAAEFRRHLEPAQLPAYEDFLAEETAAFAESSAAGELARLHALLNLTEEQKDAVFTVLAAQASAVHALADESAKTLAEVRERWEAFQQREADALEPLLDDVRKEAYRKQAAVRHTFMTGLLTERSSATAPGAPEVAQVRTATVTAVDGASFSVPDPAAAATVLVFTSTTCPIANGFAPELNRIDAEFRPRGVRLVLVQTEADLSAGKARTHAAEYGFTCPVVLDPERDLVKLAGATVTPEAAVLSPSGEILYRGRIDDRFPEVGQRWREPRHTELRDALTSVLAGKPVAVPRQKAAGCFIE